ncbi:hypothetical protein pVco7_gp027 [Vibrio phage pVco-7]|uniref:Uncharacterized protein n=1 Tax=Vibrio phage pVco-5 TaxID=1965485 RepID=A0A1W6JUY7_9CAUD|nr:hypothetical protein KNT61_gp027 [Vibrio phage pVco-5]ARM71015.1 hypothetical protein pVco5_027 [Vibrio phage pVco-5]
MKHILILLLLLSPLAQAKTYKYGVACHWDTGIKVYFTNEIAGLSTTSTVYILRDAVETHDDSKIIKQLYVPAFKCYIEQFN